MNTKEKNYYWTDLTYKNDLFKPNVDWCVRTDVRTQSILSQVSCYRPLYCRSIMRILDWQNVRLIDIFLALFWFFVAFRSLKNDDEDAQLVQNRKCRKMRCSQQHKHVMMTHRKIQRNFRLFDRSQSSCSLSRHERPWAWDIFAFDKHWLWPFKVVNRTIQIKMVANIVFVLLFRAVADADVRLPSSRHRLVNELFSKFIFCRFCLVKVIPIFHRKIVYSTTATAAAANQTPSYQTHTQVYWAA